MTTAYKRWQTVVLLVVGDWCKTKGHQHVLYKNWRAIPFILLALSLRQRSYIFMQSLGQRKTNIVCMRQHVVLILS